MRRVILKSTSISGGSISFDATRENIRAVFDMRELLKKTGRDLMARAVIEETLEAANA